MCTREQLSAWSASGGDERPVFICGMPRSGTTLVEQILAATRMFTPPASRLSWRSWQANWRPTPAPTIRPACQAARNGGPDAAGRYKRRCFACRRCRPRHRHHAMNYLYLALAIGAVPAGARRAVHARSHGQLPVHLPATADQPARLCPRPADPGPFLRPAHATGPALAGDAGRRPGGGSLRDPGKRARKPDPEPAGALRPALRLGLPGLPRDGSPGQVAKRQPGTQPLYSSSVGAWRKYEHHLALLKEALGLLED